MKNQPLTWGSLPESMLRRMSPADRETALRRAAGPVPIVAAPADHRPPPDGWRARMNAKPERPPKGYSEHKMQCELVAWSVARAGEFQSAKDLSFLFAVPNQGERSKATRGKMIREGLKSGVPDLLLPVPRAGFCGAALEMKVAPNRVSDNQAAWLDGLEAIGWRCAVAYTLAEAQSFLCKYLTSNE